MAYGLFIGGENLEGDDQRYSYFIIRENNQFLVKQRDGGETSNDRHDSE